MKFANATKFDRKSGVAYRSDLQFPLIEKRNPEAIRPWHFPKHLAWSSASLGVELLQLANLGTASVHSRHQAKHLGL
jgi:hypothetical protein